MSRQLYVQRSAHSRHTTRETGLVRTKELQLQKNIYILRDRSGSGESRAGSDTHFEVINLHGCHRRRQQIVLAVIREILMRPSITLY